MNAGLIEASGDVKDMMQNNASLPRSGKWTKEEDERLLSLTSEHGLLWTKFCQYFEYRTASDLLQRYTKLRGMFQLLKRSCQRIDGVTFTFFFSYRQIRAAYWIVDRIRKAKV